MTSDYAPRIALKARGDCFDRLEITPKWFFVN